MVPRGQRKRRKARDRLIDLRDQVCLFATDVQQNGERNRVVSFQANMRSPKLRAVIEVDLKSARSNRCGRLAVSAPQHHRSVDLFFEKIQLMGGPTLPPTPPPTQPDGEARHTRPKPRG